MPKNMSDWEREQQFISENLISDAQGYDIFALSNFIEVLIETINNAIANDEDAEKYLVGAGGEINIEITSDTINTSFTKFVYDPTTEKEIKKGQQYTIERFIDNLVEQINEELMNHEDADVDTFFKNGGIIKLVLTEKGTTVTKGKK